MAKCKILNFGEQWKIEKWNNGTFWNFGKHGKLKNGKMVKFGKPHDLLE